MARYVRKKSVLVWFGLIGSGVIACSTDDVPVAPPRGPKALAIASVQSLASTVSEPGGALPIDCSGPILVSITPFDFDITSGIGRLGDFMLAPPGWCDANTNCGWIVVEVLSEDDQNAPALYSVQAISSPVRLDLPSSLVTGTITLQVRLRDSLGERVKTDEDEVLSARFQVTCSSQ